MNDEITLKLPLAFVNQCLEALAERPIKVAMPVFNSIKDQAQKQIEQAQQMAHDAAADASDRATGAPPPGIN